MSESKESLDNVKIGDLSVINRGRVVSGDLYVAGGSLEAELWGENMKTGIGKILFQRNDIVIKLTPECLHDPKLLKIVMNSDNIARAINEATDERFGTYKEIELSRAGQTIIGKIID